MKQQRKKKLQQRANRYAIRSAVAAQRLPESQRLAVAVAVAYEDAYKACMRELRKIVAQAVKSTADIVDPCKRMRVRDCIVRQRVQKFLRPLR